EMPEMLVEPRPPLDTYRIAGLQHRPHARAGPSPHQTEMAAVRNRHHFENGVSFAVTAHAQHDAFVGPVHRIRPWRTILTEHPLAVRINVAAGYFGARLLLRWLAGGMPPPSLSADTKHR